MKHLIVSLTIGACLLLPSAGMGQSVTKNPPSKQPGTNAGVNCGTATGPNTPGNAAMAQGAPFNSLTPGTAGGVYANVFNGGGSSLNSNNLSATSQYDIACANTQAP
jgi:hypothetical protein